jgi:5'/3'-nucleotidase SurE
MRILITNDDGVYSPGIAALAEVASAFGDVRIVAPDVEMSSAGHAITASRPLTYKRTPLHGLEAYRVNGTPADCVALGTHNWDKVDVVLSGINLGSNLGNGMWHSGTLAAAKQAVLLGCRGIALSAPVTAQGEPDFELLKPAVREVLERLLPADLKLVNVNFPETRPKGTVLDAAIGPPLRRQDRAGRRPDGPLALLVRRLSDRGDGRGHGPVGRGARPRLHDPAAARPHERGRAGEGARGGAGRRLTLRSWGFATVVSLD